MVWEKKYIDMHDVLMMYPKKYGEAVTFKKLHFPEQQQQLANTVSLGLMYSTAI
jgi:hypothetical protein